MALPVYTSSAFTGQGGLEIAAEASVEVRSEADDSLVTLYSDRAGTEQINNPFQADEYGRFAFFGAANADGWRITVTSGDDAHTLRYQQPMGAACGVQAESFMMTFLDSANETAAQAALALGALAARDTVDTDQIDDGAVTTAKIEESQRRLPGEVTAFAMSTAPTGWLECDGSEVSRTTYADLFEAIGTTFGEGDEETTFNLPDLRGEFIRGWDNGRDVDSGRAFGSSQDEAFKEHNHIQGTTHERSTQSNHNKYGVSEETVNAGDATDTDPERALPYTSSTGGAETRPRNVALMYCIKT